MLFFGFFCFIFSAGESTQPPPNVLITLFLPPMFIPLSLSLPSPSALPLKLSADGLGMWLKLGGAAHRLMMTGVILVPVVGGTGAVARGFGLDCGISCGCGGGV